MKLLLHDDWKKSASFRDDIPFQKEAKFRHDIYEFARGLETCIGNTESKYFHIYFQKALSIFHRFSHQVSFRKFDRYIYMTACLFLSAKDIDIFSWNIDRYVKFFLLFCARIHKTTGHYCEEWRPRNKLAEEWKQVLPDPQLINESPLTFEESVIQTYTKKILDAESSILQLIGYDLNIYVPQLFFDELQHHIQIVQGDQRKMLFDNSQKLLNDFLMTDSCLYYEPKVIAMSALQMYSTIEKLTIQDLSNGQPWYSLFDASPNEAQQTYALMAEVQKYFEEFLKAIK